MWVENFRKLGDKLYLKDVCIHMYIQYIHYIQGEFYKTLPGH